MRLNSEYVVANDGSGLDKGFRYPSNLLSPPFQRTSAERITRRPERGDQKRSGWQGNPRLRWIPFSLLLTPRRTFTSTRTRSAERDIRRCIVIQKIPTATTAAARTRTSTMRDLLFDVKVLLLCCLDCSLSSAPVCRVQKMTVLPLG